jgi:hypothetical protein
MKDSAELYLRDYSVLALRLIYGFLPLNVLRTHANSGLPKNDPFFDFDAVAAQSQKLHTFFGTRFRASETHTFYRNFGAPTATTKIAGQRARSKEP